MQMEGTKLANEEVKDWAGVHLLHFDASPCSQKVRILLNEKNIVWQSHHIDLRQRQHVTPWFLGINPRGVVPVLVHEGVVHLESNDILEYLDGLPSDRAPFFPRNPVERAHVREELAFESSLRLGTRALTFKFMPPQAGSLKNRRALDEYRKNGSPDLSRDMEIAWWQSKTDNGVSRETLIDAFASHRDALWRLEDRLQDREYLYGKRVSVLDIAWLTTVHRLKALGFDLSRHPYLLAYYHRLLRRPAFRKSLQINGPLKIIVPAYRLYNRMTGSNPQELVANPA
jgi:glutathione S-transferase